MKQRPNIGITSSYGNGKIFMNENYFHAVWSAGGMPVFLPRSINAILDYSDTMDGLLLSGGGDIAPERFGEAKLGDSVICSPDRDEFEFEILKQFSLKNKPVLGICRGMQLIAVALGGSLFQDITGHRRADGDGGVSHKVFFSGGLAEIMKQNEAVVNSFHHQAIKSLPDELTIEAVSEDGIIEAVTKRDHPFLHAVQWHPEGMMNGDGISEKLFRAFVKACGIRKKSDE